MTAEPCLWTKYAKAGLLGIGQAVLVTSIFYDYGNTLVAFRVGARDYKVLELQDFNMKYPVKIQEFS